MSVFISPLPSPSYPQLLSLPLPFPILTLPLPIPLTTLFLATHFLTFLCTSINILSPLTLLSFPYQYHSPSYLISYLLLHSFLQSYYSPPLSNMRSTVYFFNSSLLSNMRSTAYFFHPLLHLLVHRYTNILFHSSNVHHFYYTTPYQLLSWLLLCFSLFKISGRLLIFHFHFPV